MKTLVIEVEEYNYNNLLNLLNNIKINIIQYDNKFHEIKEKKYFKQDVLNCLAYQGSTTDSENIDDLIYL
jgi:hypothetical protein